MRNDRDMDQAEGLRRLLTGNRTRVIGVVSGKAGVGSSCVALNLAAALARSGKDVLVLDENQGPDNLAKALGLKTGHDLLDAARGKCAPGDALLETKGFTVLPAGRAMAALASLRPPELARLEQAIADAADGADVIMVDAMPLFPGTHHRSIAAKTSSLSRGGALLVVADATPSGITESYALIKRLALDCARERFAVVLNKVSDGPAAKTALENMARVARLNLAVQLDCLGYIPLDDSMKRATQLHRSVVEAFPVSPAALACLELAQGVLALPSQQDETGGIQSILRNLMKSLQHNGREMAHVVN